MAIAKVHAIHGDLYAAIKYITNPDKTMQQDLVYSYGCSVNFAAVEMGLIYKRNRKSNATRTAYHLIQSFDPEDDLTPEKAFELGKEFAEKVVGKNRQYVISTHVDRGHIHNHIIFNSVPFKGNSNKMYRWTYAEKDRIEKINDKICSDNGLYVIIKKSGEKGKTWNNCSKSYSALEKIKACIDYCIDKSNNFEELAAMLKEQFDIEMRIGKTITFSMPDDRFDSGIFKCRDRRLGPAYSPVALQNRMDGMDYIYDLVTKKYKSGNVRSEKKIRKITDVMSNKKARNSQAYANSLYTSNASASLQTLNYVLDSGYSSIQEFYENYKKLEAEYNENATIMNDSKSRASEINSEITFVKNYRNNKKLYDTYNKLSGSVRDSFHSEHEKELIDFELAKMHFNEKEPYIDPYKLHLKDMFAELKELKEGREELNEKNKKIKQELNDNKVVIYNIEKMLGYDKKNSGSSGENSKNSKNIDYGNHDKNAKYKENGSVTI